ncbi:hypothetical protein B0A52_09496 [Exophiala mesophila]|uniref:Transmembrane protein 135 N-terminal domain-containing protein n=1 Tax=Exophiala mesophila TaxID=212818 RepID=A0A438MU85_EXOME|nr:hypothetical protein B0A52_09496 [Exophiala mesophila]
MAVENSPIRYVLNERELQLLRRIIKPSSTQSSHAPAPTNNDHNNSSSSTTTTSSPFETQNAREHHNAATVRSASRVFLLTYGSLKSIDLLLARLANARKSPTATRSRQPLVASPGRMALSLSSLLFLHSTLYRILHTLRLRLLHEKVRAIQDRYPRIYAVLTSKLAPAIGASLSGLALGICPADQLRITVAIYIASRSLEIGYKSISQTTWVKENLPSWFGSWLVFAVAQGQLLHAFVFDRECFPDSYGAFIIGNTPEYIQRRPENLSARVRWPHWNDIVDALAQMATLKWPQFTSPILHPDKYTTLPASISPVISPITARAHPAIQNLSCSLLHPSDPSCFLAYLRHNLLSFPRIARFYTIYYGVFAVLLRFRSLKAAPIAALNRLVESVLRSSIATTGAIGASWGSICLFQAILPRAFLPKFRFFLGGLMGGMFQLVDQTASGHATDMYAARASVDSLWKVGVKRRWWKGIRGGDVWLFVAALALVNVVFDVGQNTDAAKDRAMTLIRVLRGQVELGLQKEKVQTSDATSTDDLKKEKVQ